MEWLYYLLEANLYLLLFYGLYRLFLANETFYNNNRYYLLLSCLTAFILPVLQLGFLKPTPIVDDVLFPMPILYTTEKLVKITATPIKETIDYTTYLYPIYLFIAFCFTIKLTISIVKIIRLWAKAKKTTTGKITVIEFNEQTTAFSFFNLLFIHPHLAEKETVLNHEMVHIKQKHSLDILFYEIIQIICWFNPIIHFIKKDIKLLHEYIADELSTNSDIHKHDYAMFLIENSFGVVPTPLTNQIFNQSILKKRINMLNKKRTAGWARLKMLLALPLVGAMLCTSTMAFTKNYGYVDLLPEKSKVTEAVPQEVPQVEKLKKQNTPNAETTKKNQVEFPPPIIKPDGKNLKNQSTFEPPAIDYKPKNITDFKVKGYLISGNKNNVTDVTEAIYPTPVKVLEVLDRSNGKKLIIPSSASETKSLTIVNKWGTVLYKNNNYNNDWDGFEGNANEFKGKIIALDTYYYVVTIKDSNGKDSAIKGWITII